MTLKIQGNTSKRQDSTTKLEDSEKEGRGSRDTKKERVKRDQVPVGERIKEVLNVAQLV